jgi:3-oxoacyl-[acyl-carrier-protein] synthase-3
MLINAGIFRGDSLGEPALAALIQDDIGAYEHGATTGHGAFSFDVLNGECGVLTGAFLLDGFLRSGAIKLGMTVASDVKPRRARGYSFAPVGGALLLGWHDTTPGFEAFRFDTFPEYAGTLDAHIQWEPSKRRGLGRRRPGRNRVHVRQASDYLARALECAGISIERFLREQNLTIADLDLLVTNEPAPGFVAALAKRLGVSEARVVGPPRATRGAHTAGLLAALEVGGRTGQLEQARHALLLAVGAGITVALALYRGRQDAGDTPR